VPSLSHNVQYIFILLSSLKPESLDSSTRDVANVKYLEVFGPNLPTFGSDLPSTPLTLSYSQVWVTTFFKYESLH